MHANLSDGTKIPLSMKEIGSMKGAGSWSIDGLYGGTLLGARGAGFVIFWSWETGKIVRHIDVNAKSVSIASTFPHCI